MSLPSPSHALKTDVQINATGPFFGGQGRGMAGELGLM